MPEVVPGYEDRDEDVNGGVDGQEDHGGRAEGSELLTGFDTPGFGILNGKAGKVGSEAQGRDRLWSCLGSKESQHWLSTKEETGLSGSDFHPLEQARV